MPETVHVVVARRVEDVNAADWSRVVSESAAPVFYRLAYLRSYESNPIGSYAGAFYLTAYLGDRPVAVLPVFLQPRPDPLNLLPPGAGGAPGLLGHVWYCYDTRIPTVLADPRAMYEAVLDRLEALRAELSAGVCGLVNVAADDPLLAAAGQRGWHTAEADARYRIPVAEFTDFADYLATLHRGPRQNLGRHLRRAADAGATASVATPDPDTLAEVCELCRHTAAKFGNAGFYAPDTFVPFVRGLGDSALVVRVDGATGLLAAAVALVDDTRLHMWVAGFRRATVDGFSPHYVLWAAEIREAIARRLRVVEAGRRNDEFKQRHGATRTGLHLCLALTPPR
jgi:predicted N-acyltransferase